MNNLTISDCIKGEYYHVTLENDPNSFLIIRYDRMQSCGARLSGPIISNMNNYPNFNFNVDGAVYVTGRPMRKALDKEINWLNKCITAGKFVEKSKSEVVNDYQIY